MICEQIYVGVSKGMLEEIAREIPDGILGRVFDLFKNPGRNLRRNPSLKSLRNSKKN